jgi:hypothetical protein
VTNIVQLNNPFQVTALGWSLRTDPTQAGKGEIADFTLDYAPLTASYPAALPSGSQHDVSVPKGDCGGPFTYTMPNFNWYSFYQAVLIQNPEYFTAADFYFYKKWTVYNDGGSVLGRKNFTETFVYLGSTEATTTKVVLTHTPAH